MLIVDDFISSVLVNVIVYSEVAESDYVEIVKKSNMLNELYITVEYVLNILNMIIICRISGICWILFEFKTVKHSILIISLKIQNLFQKYVIHVL